MDHSLSLPHTLVPKTEAHCFALVTFIMVFAFVAGGCSTAKTKTNTKQAEEKGPHIPKVFMPGATCETIKEKIEGRRWEEAHLVCTLKDAVWSPE